MEVSLPPFVGSKDDLADIFMNAFPRDETRTILPRLGRIDIYALLGRGEGLREKGLKGIFFFSF